MKKPHEGEALVLWLILFLLACTFCSPENLIFVWLGFPAAYWIIHA